MNNTRREIQISKAGTFSFGIVAAMLLLASSVVSPRAHAALGQCRWEGGAGAAGGFQYCELEDCLGNGGLAQCSSPIVEPTIPFTDTQVGPEKWAYFVCDEAGPSIPVIARWCVAAGGTWTVPALQCLNLPPGYLGNPIVTNDEALAVSTANAFIGLTYPGCPGAQAADTGWGITIGFTQCWGGGSESAAGIAWRDLRRRVYQIPAPCSSEFTITMLRQRAVACPAGYRSRTGTGGLQCYIPADAACPIGNPVSPVTGAKFHEETDYRAAGPSVLEFKRFYNSAGYFRPIGAAVSGGPLAVRTLSDFWRHTYDRRLYPVNANPELMAMLQREDGSLRHFNATGQEILNRDGAAARLQFTSGTGWQLTLANSDVERYDTSGRLISITTRAGAATTISYDASGRISSALDQFGRALTFGYNGAGQLSAVTIPGGSAIGYGYDSAGRLITATYPGSAVKTYHYENTRNQWLLTGITDESNQRFATYTYDDFGILTASEHAGGVNRYQFTYNSPGTITTVRDPLNTSRQYNFQNVRGANKLISLFGGACADCGSSAQISYDANGNVSQRADFNQNRTTYIFDQARNLETSRTEGLNSLGNPTPRTRTITTQWHPTFRLPTQIDEPNRRTSFTHDANGNVLTRTVTDVSVTPNSSRTWTYTYNSVGQVLTENGPRTDVNDVITYVYNECSTGFECGQVRTVTNPAGHLFTYLTYNAHGQPLTFADPNGLLTTLAYDARQRLISRQVGGETTTVTYYPTGLVRRVTLPDGSFVENTYDAAHRLTVIADGDENRITYTLDAGGNRTREDVFDPSNALARTRSWVYNALGRLTQEIGAANQTTAYIYDNNGNLDTVTDPRNRITNNDYDELNRLVRVTDAASGVTQFGYDPNDNPTSITDPRSLATVYAFNGLGDLTRTTSPDTGITQYAPDGAGNVDLATDARNRSGDYSYDALNRVTQIAYSDQTVSFEYDQGPNARGQLTRVTDASGSTQWSYNAQGRIASKQQTTGGVVRSVSYGYNGAGHLTQTTTPSGQIVAYGYTNQRITSVTVNGTTLLSQALYEPFGATRGWTWGNGTLAVREHDLDGQLTTIDSAGLSTYTFFPDGTLQSRTDENPMSFGLATGTTNYVLAGTSNRLSSSSGVQTRMYGHDAAGNTLSDGRTFAYNDAGRMSSATVAGVTTSYLVNGLGQRVRKGNAATTRLFVYDESAHLLGEYDQAGNFVQETVWLEDIPVATLRPRSGGGIDIFFVHTDHLNTPRKITRPSDNRMLWRWESDPFGQAAPNEDADGDGQSFSYHLRFPGQYFDTETGLNYNYFRDYDPAIGRYVESDPIGLKGGINTYSYANQSPLRYVDPTGAIPLLVDFPCLLLRGKVILLCKETRRRCEAGDTCDVLRTKALAHLACAIAQDQLTQKCYPNDPTHRQRITDTVNGARRCADFYESKCGVCPAPPGALGR